MDVLRTQGSILGRPSLAGAAGYSSLKNVSRPETRFLKWMRRSHFRQESVSGSQRETGFLFTIGYSKSRDDA